MDPAVAGLDFAKAGIVLANMIESYLAGGVPPSNPEGAVHDKPQDCHQHLSRQAYVYVRQSTPGQVRFNQESTERQYNLAGKAESLGWSPDRIRTLDRDLGQSGARMTGREDFKALVSDVALGQV